VAAGEALAGKMNSGGEQRQASHDVGIVSGAQWNLPTFSAI